jgi:hypothetical protein
MEAAVAGLVVVVVLETVVLVVVELVLLVLLVATTTPAVASNGLKASSNSRLRPAWIALLKLAQPINLFFIEGSLSQL